MEREPVPTSSVFFGADGTQLPDPLPVLPDALTGPEHSRWADDIPELAPAPLPPMPDGRAMREAITAALGDAPQAPPPAPAGHGPPGQAPYRPLVPVPYQPPGPVAPRAQPATPARPTLPRAVAPTAPGGELRRRSGPESARGLQTRSSSGVRIGCVIALIIFGVVAFNIIAGLVQAVAGLFS